MSMFISGDIVADINHQMMLSAAPPDLDGSVAAPQPPATSRVRSSIIGAYPVLFTLPEHASPALDGRADDRTALYQSVLSAKKQEYDIVLRALKQAVSRELATLGIKNEEVESEEQAVACVRNYFKTKAAFPSVLAIQEHILKKAERTIEKLAKRFELSDQSRAILEYLKRADILSRSVSEIVWELQYRGLKLTEDDLRESVSALQRARLDGTSLQFSSDYELLTEQAAQIAAGAVGEEEGTREGNKELLLAIRAALQNPAYQFLKEDESHPLVHFFHSLSLASYAEPKLLAAFSELGGHLGHAVSGRQDRSIRFDEFFKASWVHAEGCGLNSTWKIIGIWEYIKQCFHRFSSTFVGKLFRDYDPRAGGGNNAGVLFEEVFEKKDSREFRKLVKIKRVYTPSPTIGQEVAPEAHGILQAMENRHFMTKEQLGKEREGKEGKKFQPVCWVYTNMQNITSRNEGPRSKAIMRLNVEYPFSFRGCTLSVDSRFYKAGLRGKGAVIHDSAKDAEPLDEAYKRAAIEQFTNENNFLLDDRKGEDAGHYFYCKNSMQKAAYRDSIVAVITMAYDTARACARPDTIASDVWNWNQKASFRELVNMGISRLLRAQVMQELAVHGTFQDTEVDIEIFDTEACKQCIDRGGKANAEALWALGEDVPMTDFAAFSALHARPLLADFRLIHQDRVSPFYALTMCMRKEQVQKFLLDVMLTQDAKGVKTTRIQKATPSF